MQSHLLVRLERQTGCWGNEVQELATESVTARGAARAAPTRKGLERSGCKLIGVLRVAVLCGLAQSCGPADSDSNDPHAAGGKAGTTGAAGGATSGSGGAGTAGAPVAGTSGAPVAGTGGTPAAGAGGVAAAGTGGTPAGGTGGEALGGAGGQGVGGSGDIWGGLKNPPRKSPGCDKPAMLTNGKKTIVSSGVMRSYIIDIPANYDPAKPYRLFYASHGLGGSAEGTVGSNYFGLKSHATSANEPAIFVAGQGPNRNGNNTWGEAEDHVFFDDVTNAVKSGLCVDTTRVFITGMSMGGMYSYSLSTDRQKGFRAGVGLAPTNFNIWLPNPKLKDPVAWMQTTGNADTYCPWVTNEADKRGSKFIALEKAANNGCAIPETIPTWQSGNHLCYDFAGCKPGYPVKACTFAGPHTDNARDPGSNVNWIAKESWDFFMQF
jgi:poly(3-hydroxybutyrate) depolymerase